MTSAATVLVAVVGILDAQSRGYFWARVWWGLGWRAMSHGGRGCRKLLAVCVFGDLVAAISQVTGLTELFRGVSTTSDTPARSIRFRIIEMVLSKKALIGVGGDQLQCFFWGGALSDVNHIPTASVINNGLWQSNQWQMNKNKNFSPLASSGYDRSVSTSSPSWNTPDHKALHFQGQLVSLRGIIRSNKHFIEGQITRTLVSTDPLFPTQQI